MHDLERARRLHPVSALLAALVLASPSFAQSLPPETHDPEPVGQGSSQWLTWAQINKYIDGATEADVKFLTAV